MTSEPTGQPSPPEPPPPTGPEAADRSSGGRRALAVLLALALAFGAAVMILLAIELGQDPICDDVEFIGSSPAEDCFDISSGQKAVSLALSWVSGAIGALAVLLALAFAITGRRGTLLLQATGLAVLVGGVAILVGSL